LKILARLNHLYHLASLGPVVREFIRRSHDVEFSCENESESILGIPVSRKHRAEKELSDNGFTIAQSTHGYDIVLTGDILPKPEIYAPAILIFINHGTGIKSVMYRLLKQWPTVNYHIMVEGRYRKERIIENNAIGNSRIHIVGYPKLDPILRSEISSEDIIDRYILDPDKPTVLFAPSHKPSAIDVVGDSICEATIGTNLLVKLHPFSWGGKYAPHRHHRLFESAVKKYPHVKLVNKNESDILPFISAADVLITGVSSTMFEFLAAGKFGALIKMPNRERRDGTMTMDTDPSILFESAWPIANGIKDLHDAVLSALDPDDEMIENAAKLRDYLFSNLDGRASERIVDIGENLFKEGGHCYAP